MNRNSNTLLLALLAATAASASPAVSPGGDVLRGLTTGALEAYAVVLENGEWMETDRRGELSKHVFRFTDRQRYERARVAAGDLRTHIDEIDVEVEELLASLAAARTVDDRLPNESLIDYVDVARNVHVRNDLVRVGTFRSFDFDTRALFDERDAYLLDPATHRRASLAELRELAPPEAAGGGAFGQGGETRPVLPPGGFHGFDLEQVAEALGEVVATRVRDAAATRSRLLALASAEHAVRPRSLGADSVEVMGRSLPYPTYRPGPVTHVRLAFATDAELQEARGLAARWFLSLVEARGALHGLRVLRRHTAWARGTEGGASPIDRIVQAEVRAAERGVHAAFEAARRVELVRGSGRSGGRSTWVARDLHQVLTEEAVARNTRSILP